MGKVYSHIAWRISRNFNVETRAQKLLAKEKIRPPPKLKSTEKYLETLRKEQPEFGEELLKKDDDLLKRLEGVYVKSKDPAAVDRTAPDRREGLPVDRTPYQLTRSGYSEPSRVPYGRVTLQAALGFLAQHAEQPDKHTAQSIALQHKLDPLVVEHILKHFRLMKLHEPEVDTGQIRQISWTTEDPISERPFKDEHGNLKIPSSIEELYPNSYKQEDVPPVPTGQNKPSPSSPEKAS